MDNNNSLSYLEQQFLREEARRNNIEVRRNNTEEKQLVLHLRLRSPEEIEKEMQKKNADIQLNNVTRQIQSMTMKEKAESKASEEYNEDDALYDSK